MLRIHKNHPKDLRCARAKELERRGSSLACGFGFLQEVQIPDICTRNALPLSMSSGKVDSKDIFKTITKPADEVNSSQAWN